MPLSEQEQRLLEEMERSLYQSDDDFVGTLTALHEEFTTLSDEAETIRQHEDAAILGILG